MKSKGWLGVPVHLPVGLSVGAPKLATKGKQPQIAQQSSVVVQYKVPLSAKWSISMDSSGAGALSKLFITNGRYLVVPASALAELAVDPNRTGVMTDPRIHRRLNDAAPAMAPDYTRSEGLDGLPAGVAVVDSGIHHAHAPRQSSRGTGLRTRFVGGTQSCGATAC